MMLGLGELVDFALANGGSSYYLQGCKKASSLAWQLAGIVAGGRFVSDAAALVLADEAGCLQGFQASSASSARRSLTYMGCPWAFGRWSGAASG